MSGATAIGLVSESLQRLLTAGLKDDHVEVTLLSPEETGGSRRVNLFLYKVQENALLKNQDWQVRPGAGTSLAPPPLSLNLFYLLTAYATTDKQTGNRTAHSVLGEAMRVLYEHPLIPDEHLVEGLRATREQIKIMLAPIDMEELSRVWGTFGKPLRPTVMYEVSVVQIDAAAGRERAIARRVREVAVPHAGAPFLPPALERAEPARAAAGARITIVGRHLDAGRPSAHLGGAPLPIDGEVRPDSFAVVLPEALGPGLYELRADVGELCRRTFFVEVIVAPTLERIAPASGPAGSTITVYGRHLAACKALLRIDGEPLHTTGRLKEDRFAVALPPDLAPGGHAIEVEVEQLCKQTFFFEVQPL